MAPPSGKKELTVEKVTFDQHPKKSGTWVPTVLVWKKNPSAPTSVDGDDEETKGEKRPFEAGDVRRVLDFTDVPEPPDDAKLMICDGAEKKTPRFPSRFFILRAHYLLYFDLEDVEDGEIMGAPLGCVPLQDTVVEYPPGGRRVFREHAMTDARTGYEILIRHKGVGSDGEPRQPNFVVCSGLGQREEWAKALKARAAVGDRETKLRPGGALDNLPSADSPGKRGSGARRSGKNAKKQEMDSKEQAEIEKKNVDQALKHFGQSRFNEVDWVNKYFETHQEFDAPNKCRELDSWQGAIKKGLRESVLEQYEYFVEASKEMTTMGKEVSALRNLCDGQSELIRNMKNIDFAAAFADAVGDDYEGYSDEEMEDEMDDGMGSESKESSTKKSAGLGTGASSRSLRSRKGAPDDATDASSVASSQSSHSAWSGKPKRGGKKGKLSSRLNRRGSNQESIAETSTVANHPIEPESTIEIPSWLADATEEISAFIKECRYTDATELTLKAKAEVSEIMNQHEKLTDRRLNKKQLASMKRILEQIDGLTSRMCTRLAEGLRRKNEALKLSAKRERADPLSIMAPLVSPVCLNDDEIALQLLVKLGKPQDAATAYAARRSLLLMESLYERPIASSGSAGTMDVVIYAAQLSQSFFSCLSNSVEGFLDLFLNTPKDDEIEKDNSLEDSSIQSAAGKKIPPGALSAVVLWCDSELAKFSAAFGGHRVLGNLALSPPPRASDSESAFSKKLLGMSSTNPASTRESLRAAEEMGEFAAAANLRKKLAEQDKKTRVGDDLLLGIADNKDRLAAIEVAAKCVDQSFQFASENLDSIGLPLTPRLGEFMRAKLKGCEAEIAVMLKGRWDHITFDWGNEIVDMDDSRSRMDLRAAVSNEDI